MMQVLQTPRFSRQLKKLKKNQKEAVDQAVQDVMEEPLIGTQKKGDLNYLRVYKFTMLHQQALLAYSYDNENIIVKLLGVGSHENFYRDMKK